MNPYKLRVTVNQCIHIYASESRASYKRIETKIAILRNLQSNLSIMFYFKYFSF